MTVLDVAPDVAPEANAPPPTRRGGRRVIFGLAFVVAVLLVFAVIGVFLTGENESTLRSSTPTSNASAVDHRNHLMPMEAKSLAAELVDVPGYRYEDVPDAELRQVLQELKETSPGAANAHTVWDAVRNAEIGFLMLATGDPTDAMHSQAMERALAQQVCGCGAMARIGMSGQGVWRGEWPDRPESRYVFVWSRQGTLGWLDGPEQASLEDWLRKYMAIPVVGEGESARVVAQLRPLHVPVRLR